MATGKTVVAWYGDEVLKALREATPEGLFAGAEMLLEAAKKRAPEMTGNLKESGYAATSQKSTYKADKRHNKEIKIKDGQALAAFAMFYAGFVEYGTKKKSAKPFLRPAMDELKSVIGDEIGLKIAKKFK